MNTTKKQLDESCRLEREKSRRKIDELIQMNHEKNATNPPGTRGDRHKQEMEYGERVDNLCERCDS